MSENNGTLDFLTQVSKLYQDVTQKPMAARITLETNVTPPISLVGGEQSQAMEWITGLIKPTVRFGDTVIYAPAGEASRTVGAYVFWFGLALSGGVILYLLAR